MTAADGVLLLILGGLVAYAVLGGADFGGGVWDLLASGPRRDAQRERIAASMAPVWEANHVWLVFVLIGLFSAFPIGFGTLCRLLVLPLALALLGIVLRGAAFAYRQYGGYGPGRPVRGTVVWGRVFAIASTATPFAFGAAGAAISTGDLAADGSSGVLAPFGSWLALVAGLLAVATCAFLAAVYTSRDSAKHGDDRLAEDFRRRALGAAVVAGGLAVAALPAMNADAPVLWDRFVDRSAPFALLSVLGGGTALVLLWRRRYASARVAAALAPIGLLAGWGAALWPDLVIGAITAADAAAPAATTRAVLVVLLLGFAAVAPALAVLLRVVRESPHHGTEPASRA